MAKFIGKTLKAFIVIGELFFTFGLSLVILMLMLAAGNELFGNSKYVDAEVVSIVDDIYTKENPDTTFGPYQYYVKYRVNNVDVILKEPIESEYILDIGDTFKIFINSKSGNIDELNSFKSIWKENDFILYGILMFIALLKVLKYCVNYLLEHGKKGIFYAIKRLIFHTISVIIFTMAALQGIEILEKCPDYINGSYGWLRTEIVYVKELDTTGSNPGYQEMHLLYEHNGRWFKHEGVFDDVLNRGVGEDCGLYTNIKTGKAVDVSLDGFYYSNMIPFVVLTIAGYITLLIGKSNPAKKRKTKSMDVNSKNEQNENPET